MSEEIKMKFHYQTNKDTPSKTNNITISWSDITASRSKIKNLKKLEFASFL